jgi:hypothetical protein
LSRICASHRELPQRHQLIPMSGDQKQPHQDSRY